MPADPLLTELCRDLRLLWEQAGGPSVRALSVRVGLGKSQVGAILNGKIRRLPDWLVVRGLVEACYKHAHDHDRSHRLSLQSGLDEYWRPRYAMLEHAASQPARPATTPAEPAPVTTTEPASSPARPAAAMAGPAPRQLPATAPHFVGRNAELAALTRATSGSGPLLVTGMAGVGKTTLAVGWAHQVAGEFPDGQLYANLRGFDPSGSAMEPTEAIRGFLDALGVPAERVPATLDAQAGLYRSLLAGKRVLVVLDNARDAEQVRPLLPGAPGCQVVITSRVRLNGLVAADGAHPVTLDLLSSEEARDLLALRLGADRLAAEPDAVEEIIARCGRLPLALTVVAARATYGDFRLATVADELRAALGGLEAFDGDDPATDVQAVFSWSYRALSDGAARVFRLLAVHPGPDISVRAAASLAGLPSQAVRPLLAELVRAHLLGEHVPGRYAFHDLLRAYAAGQADSEDRPETRNAARGRMLDHYLHGAFTASRLLKPTLTPFTTPAPPRPGVDPELPTDVGQALTWFAVERAVLLTVVDHAADNGFDAHAWQLAWTLTVFLDRQGFWPDLVATGRAALSAAEREANPTVQSYAHRILAMAARELGRPDDARAHLQHSLDLSDQAGDTVGQASAHRQLAVLCGRRGDHDQALQHARQSLDLERAADRKWGQATALNMVGWYQVLLGDHRQALASCQGALALLEELGDLEGQASTWDSLGYAHHHLGDHRRAIACYQRAIQLNDDTGSRYWAADALTHLGETHHAAGDVDAARTAWQRALTILDELAHPDADQVRTRLDGS